jgi:hypothetical protein
VASTCPVTQRASGEARNATTSATLDVVPSRPSGVRATIPFTAPSPIRAVAALSIAVSTRPGATVFTATPLGPSSAAESTHRDCVSQGPDPVFKPLCLHHHHLAVVGAERNSRYTLKGGEEMDREFS